MGGGQKKSIIAAAVMGGGQKKSIIAAAVILIRESKKIHNSTHKLDIGRGVGSTPCSYMVGVKICKFQ